MFTDEHPAEPQKLETLLRSSAIDASLFLPFTLFRLRPYAIDRQVSLQVSLYEGESMAPRTHDLQLFWDAANDTLVRPPVQQNVLTEWAACGIALAIVPLYTPYRVLEVAQMGDRFDYWLGQKIRVVGLEISGTMEGDLATRTKTKQQQLVRNPYKSAGYVCVVGFESRQVRLSFYREELE